MQISCDYLARKNQVLIPEVVNEVDDEKLTQIIQIVGPQQKFIDVSRCFLLNASIFNKLDTCVSLCYLDISYTNIDSIALLCDNLMCLKSLNLSGLSQLAPDAFKPLDQLVTLEYLSLRLSSIDSLEAIGGMIMLRGLDFGQTNVDNISPLGILDLYF
jgi:hypothetical protein